MIPWKETHLHLLPIVTVQLHGVYEDKEMRNPVRFGS